MQFGASRSVVVQVVDADDIYSVEHEDQPPVRVNPDGPAAGQRSTREESFHAPVPEALDHFDVYRIEIRVSTRGCELTQSQGFHRSSPTVIWTQPTKPASLSIFPFEELESMPGVGPTLSRGRSCGTPPPPLTRPARVARLRLQRQHVAPRGSPRRRGEGWRSSGECAKGRPTAIGRDQPARHRSLPICQG